MSAGGPRGVDRVGRRSARFQQWEALVRSRTQRTRQGRLLVQGVRPVSAALSHGAEVESVLVDDRARRSRWAEGILAAAPAPVVEVAGELMTELGGKEEGTPEILLVVRRPSTAVDRLAPAPDGVVLVLDRPSTPGNIGTLVRTADALGAAGVVVAGHAADPWDPAAVRAGTGSHFALPILQVAAPSGIADWVAGRRERGETWTVVGLDEAGGRRVQDVDLTGGTVLVVGTESVGMSAAWRDACDVVAEIPMGGSASSLNAAVAGSIALYERARQRG